MMSHFIGKMKKEREWDKIMDDLTSRRTDPYSVAERMLADELKGHKKI